MPIFMSIEEQLSAAQIRIAELEDLVKHLKAKNEELREKWLSELDRNNELLKKQERKA